MPRTTSERIHHLKQTFPRHKIDGLLVTNNFNIRYLTGFPAEESWFLVTPSQNYYITDFRYIHEARQGLSGIKVHQYKKAIYHSVFELCQQHKIRTLGFDDRHVSLNLFKSIQKARPKSLRFKAVNQLIELFREVKDSDEVKAIEESLKIHHQAHRFVQRHLKPGLTERELLLKLERFVKSKGAGFSFDPIIASGPNSCYPHAKVSGRRIRNNELVLVDMGIYYNGYKSDLTRMFFLGKIPKLIREVNDTVKMAQQKAIDFIKDGVSIAEVDYQARNFLKKNKLAKYFGHALGHGVGLEIHENPRLSQHSKGRMREGMVVTVEPAVYLPDQFGIRIEDMILVQKEGCKVLSDNIH